MTSSLPLVYACAGCSLAGRVAYDIAQELTHRKVAQMSCLAGIAADLPVFTKQLHDREVWVIDGCPLECAKGIFDKEHRPVDRHIRLREYGVPKNESPRVRVDISVIADRISEYQSGTVHIDQLENRATIP